MTLPGRSFLLALLVVALVAAFVATVVASTVGGSSSGDVTHTMPGGAVMQGDQMPAAGRDDGSMDGMKMP